MFFQTRPNPTDTHNNKGRTVYCFINPILGNPYGPGVSESSRAKGEHNHDLESPTDLFTLSCL